MVDAAGQGPADRSSFFRKPPAAPSGGGATVAVQPRVTAPPPPPPVPPPPEPPAPGPPPVAPRPAPAPGGGTLHRLTFSGSLGTLVGIQAVNSLLTLVTLGIYQFWGRARVRRYVMSQTALGGDRFAYHGTGRELFTGALKAFVVFGLPFGALVALGEFGALPEAVRVIAHLAAYGILFVFFAFAMVGSHRYRLSRTSLRGVKFSFRGRAITFATLFIKGAVLTGLTLGFYRPIFETRLREFLTANSYFGNQKFEFDGRGRDLLKPFVISLLLTLPTLGLYTFWYLARKQRYFWSHTRFGAARFHSTIRGGRLLTFWLGNGALLLFAAGGGVGLGLGLMLDLQYQVWGGLGGALGLALLFGVGWPWVKIRSIRFALAYLSISGPLDLAQVQQDAQAASSVGEALAGFFDIGFDF